jgi:predicted metal-dependent phosphoesterase TrpH
VVGEEVSTSDGEVIGLFLHEEIPAGLSAEESIDRIRSQDAWSSLPIPSASTAPAWAR